MYYLCVQQAAVRERAGYVLVSVSSCVSSAIQQARLSALCAHKHTRMSERERDRETQVAQNLTAGGACVAGEVAHGLSLCRTFVAN